MGFKVIIVGGGPVGLVAAHGLHNAGIDFVLLERRDTIVNYYGASIILAPASMRILSQFGLRDRLEAAGAELSQVKSFTRDGYKFKDSTQIKLLKECLGAAQVIFHRPELVQILLDGLPDTAKEKLKTQKRVVDIDQNENSVTVSCADGTTYQGAMVIGADGAYSQVRQQLRQAMQLAGLECDCDEQRPYEASYRMMWYTFPRPESTQPGLGTETQDTHRTLTYVAGKKVSAILLYEKLPVSTREKLIYSKKDIDEFAESFANYPVSETLTFKDVYKWDETTGMANLPEGIVKNFSFGRIVLVGDAAHRFTPNAGLGFNNGIQDIVAVCNNINAAVRTSNEGLPSKATLAHAFDQYRESRIGVIRKDLRGSAVLTRLQAWANTWFYILSRFLLVPDWFQRFTLRNIAVPNMKIAPVLNYIEAEEPYTGTVAWTNSIPVHRAARQGHGQS